MAFDLDIHDFKVKRKPFTKKQKITNYIMVTMALFAVNPFFGLIQNYYLMFFLFFLLIIATKRNVKYIDFNIFKVLLFAYSLVILQNLLYGEISLATLYVPLIIFYVPFLVFQLLGFSFFSYFVRVLYAIAIFTLVLWALQTFIPAVDEFFRQAIVGILPYSWAATPRSLLIYTAAWSDLIYNESLGVYRNSGLFHEPGAYGIFLVLAIGINFLLTGNMFDRRNKVFLLCTLTTLSTTAYLVLFVIFSVYLFKLNVNWGIKIIAIFAFIFGSFQVYQSGDFLKDKVESQYQDQSYSAKKELGKLEGQSGRFYAFFTSVKLFLDHPFFGRGITYNSSEKASGEMHKDGSYNYGFIGVFSTYGVFFGLFFLINLYRGLKSIATISGQPVFFILGFFIAINLSLLTQVFTLTTIFVLIFTIGVCGYMPINAKKKENQNLNNATV